ncbi:hypothetical protein 14Stepyanka_00022 [Erwinia phage Stepyanka]|uniref:Gp6.3 n=2 Tax=Elunavirus TaxID=2732681 RepID=G0YQ68_9CAUD|nr:gp6.3 [Erwinia phage vB_EamP-L1]AEJ81495.1 gp6.3 [Erwinia phage vB_EamP-L1]UTQ80041.1 hypothetical protein 14Stepyanka_00022 [Erwinia phage Stepyanka]
MEAMKIVLVVLMVGMVARGLWSLAAAGKQIAEYKKES